MLRSRGLCGAGDRSSIQVALIATTQCEVPQGMRAAAECKGFPGPRPWSPPCLETKADKPLDQVAQVLLASESVDGSFPQYQPQRQDSLWQYQWPRSMFHGHAHRLKPTETVTGQGASGSSQSHRAHSHSSSIQQKRREAEPGRLMLLFLAVSASPDAAADKLREAVNPDFTAWEVCGEAGFGLESS